MNNSKILIVEDEQLVALEIESALESLGFENIESAKNYDEAIKFTKEIKHDLLLMDINLEKSKKDGIDTSNEIKQINPNISIIYLTAYSDDTTLERAVKTQPEAYLLKPFKREELKTTLRVVFSKNDIKKDLIKNKNIEYITKHIYFDIEKKLLYKNDVPIKLSKNEKELLTLLINAKSNIVSFDDIERNVWYDKIVTDSTIRSLIHRLRFKIGPDLIKNHFGIGCQLIKIL